MIGARFKGCGKVRRSQYVGLGDRAAEGILAFCHWPNSTFSLPRCTCALPLATVISLSLDSRIGLDGCAAVRPDLRDGILAR